MSKNNLIVSLLIISVLIWLIPLIFHICKIIKSYRRKSADIASIGVRLMCCSLILVVSLCCVRFAVTYYNDMIGVDSGFSVPEMIFDSILHALQTMTINEDCSGFVKDSKQMIEYLYSGGHVSGLKNLFGFYVSSLNLVTPISGGAAIFSLLTAFFPKLKLKLLFFRKKYYFSDLNKKSLALAKSIVDIKTEFFKRPVLVFTDVYVDDEDEISSELYLEAKKIGAICVKNDIAHLNMDSFREKEIFLIDENENENIKHLSEMKSTDKKTLENTFIYIFYQDDAYALIEKKIKTDIMNAYRVKTASDSEKSDSASKGAIDPDAPTAPNAPIITRVKEYEGLIINLLAQKPLTEPLISNYKDGLPYPTENKPYEYNLTIIGSGKIGWQMMLSASWCGQFYGHKMNINVVSEDKKEDFEKNINNSYPEFIESARAGSPLLRVFEDSDEKNEPYFRLRYGEYDFNSTALKDIKCESLTDESGSFGIADSDYFLVAIGSDEANMLAAENLRRQISVYNLDKPAKKQKNCVIAFAVYNHNFNSVLKENSSDSSSKIKLFPFGSIDDTYSYESITMVNNDPAAIAVGKVYVHRKSYEEKTKEQTQLLKKDKTYETMSSKARSIHFKYRIFSTFMFNECRKSYTAADEEERQRILTSFDENRVKYYEDNVLVADAADDILQYLAWLEHRRWNAYMRSVGFSHYKNKIIELKLHCCLCESAKVPTDNDMLGLVEKAQKAEYKCYDYPKDTDSEIISTYRKTVKENL